MTVEDMWEKYLKSIGESIGTFVKTYEAWYFCDNETDANNLADLTRRGIKRATASLKKSYEIENEPLPKEKDLNIITDFHGAAICSSVISLNGIISTFVTSIIQIAAPWKSVIIFRSFSFGRGSFSIS